MPSELLAVAAFIKSKAAGEYQDADARNAGKEIPVIRSSDIKQIVRVLGDLARH